MADIKEALLKKEKCLKNPEDYKLVEGLYHTLKNYSLVELEEIFPAPEALKSQDLFDYTNEILGNASTDSMTDSVLNVALAMFDSDTIKSRSNETFEKDLKLLQALFFFLIKDITADLEKDYSKFFLSALSNGEWKEASKQAEILNAISADMDFNKANLFLSYDFTKLGGVHYKANESILRLFFNFTHPDLYASEGIVNELNFIREQQNNILPVYPNSQKTNYSDAAATDELNLKKKNLETLKELDCGFKDSSYTQSFFISNDEFKQTFSRPVECRCFQESKLEWQFEPHFNPWKNKGKGKIIAVKSERALNRASLYNKFLYLERNMLTHVGDIVAVYKLFDREYKDYEKRFWEELVLFSMYDARKYISDMPDKEVANKLMKILNYYFKKITSKVCPKKSSVEERWANLFKESPEYPNGKITLETKQLKKTEIFNLLDADELTHFKRFMGLMYCSENDDNDFFVRNRIRIQLYLIHMTLSLSQMDV